jgi:hypothetical protein
LFEPSEVAPVLAPVRSVQFRGFLEHAFVTAGLASHEAPFDRGSASRYGASRLENAVNERFVEGRVVHGKHHALEARAEPRALEPCAEAVGGHSGVVAEDATTPGPEHEGRVGHVLGQREELARPTAKHELDLTGASRLVRPEVDRRPEQGSLRIGRGRGNHRCVVRPVAQSIPAHPKKRHARRMDHRIRVEVRLPITVLAIVRRLPLEAGVERG